MTSERCFLDTNVLLYLIDRDARKAEIADALVRRGATVSVQILNEFVSVARRKHSLEWSVILSVLEDVRRTCKVMPVTLEVHDLALDIAIENGINIYDALIVSAAQLAHCTVLVTEDLNNGQHIGGIFIHNPFI